MVLPCRRHVASLCVYQLDTDRPVEQPKTGSERAKHWKTSQFQLSVRADRFPPATTAPPPRDWPIGGIRGGRARRSASVWWLACVAESPLTLLKLNYIVRSVLMRGDTMILSQQVQLEIAKWCIVPDLHQNIAYSRPCDYFAMHCFGSWYSMAQAGFLCRNHKQQSRSLALTEHSVQISPSISSCSS